MNACSFLKHFQRKDALRVYGHRNFPDVPILAFRLQVVNTCNSDPNHLQHEYQ